MIYRIHILLGTIVAIPVLAWATSGLLYALPERVEGGSVETIAVSKVRIPPDEAMRRANDLAGRQLPTTALTLLMRDGRPVYQAIGGMGADSILIDAEDGTVRVAPPPGWMTRYFRQAHFYFFAGSWQVPLLVVMSFLAAMSAFSGIYLNIVCWLRPRRAARTSARA